MADALLSPAVGGTMWLASIGLAGYSAGKVKDSLDQKKIPLMGVMGALIFAAQMVNFSIPGTGSSGHITGGLLLSVILGPHAAFLTMASVLSIQALFFADGGLLALGANIFNMGFFTAFVAYPLIFRKIVRNNFSSGRILSGSIIAAVVGLQFGSLSVVTETLLSGRTELPFGTFVLLMQPIHLAIGILLEGVVTSAVILFLRKERPEILYMAQGHQTVCGPQIRKILPAMLLLTVMVGGVASWFASSRPDGLEWSIWKTTGQEELKPGSNPVHKVLAETQDKMALLPDYDFRPDQTGARTADAPWPVVDTGASASGILGALMTLILALLTGTFVRIFRRKKNRAVWDPESSL
ncbi:energy-coupling factor ABC transporter permease [Candidatus Haliotispira prima]|uniref:Energy-coupling factor ABC transporter permease n=1 Tax=Candidatus Haliotispira prima TaxID=3034016 RepID=A0ABY8MKP8_9SPIO|nr:energy-coupling factor ABC transporter permease [Candidatus Haliotispira prima]